MRIKELGLTDKMEVALTGALDNRGRVIGAHISTKVGLHKRGLVEKNPIGYMHSWTLNEKGKEVANFIKSKS